MDAIGIVLLSAPFLTELRPADPRIHGHGFSKFQATERYGLAGVDYYCWCLNYTGVDAAADREEG